jgi:pSer/pThr/pTyr-binding forkhead associated (FHA) protein
MSELFLRPVVAPFACLDFPLRSGVWIIGRSKDCDVVVRHPSVSRHHAKIVVKNGRARLTDLDSRNGTWLDDKAVARSEALAAGQELRLGKIPFAILQWNAPERKESQLEEITAPCDSDQAEDPRAQLSPAERRVLDEIWEGGTVKEIAAKLSLRPGTVHNHITAIYEYFGVHSRAELMARRIPKTKKTRAGSDA